MSEITKLFLLILFLTYIACINEEKEKAIEITIGSTVEFNRTQNFLSLIMKAKTINSYYLPSLDQKAKYL